MPKLYLGIHLNNNYFNNNILDALKETKRLGANTLQIYLGSKILTTLREKIILSKNEEKEIKDFLKKNDMKIFIHAILRLNFCNDPKLKRNEWALDNLIYDINLCKKINGRGVVIHMGTHKTLKLNISYNDCINNFVESLKIILDKTKKIPILLETPVNRKNIVAGTIEGMANLYHSFPEEYKKRIKICIDTQHIFASGYNISKISIINDYFEKIDKLINIKNVLLIHLNDSLKKLNSLVNRHAPIGKGFIFSNNKESLIEIINYGFKNNISFVLETNYENYLYEIKFIKSLLLKGGEKDNKNLILKIFKEILFFHESLGKRGNISTRYRIDSYIKAIKTIEKYDKPIYDCKDVKDLPSIGKGFCEKIDEISKTGTLKIYEDIIKNSDFKSFKIFLNIWGVGPEFAKKLIDKKIYNIKELKNAIKEKRIILNEQQLIGLKYYNDLNIKIPRDEITEYTNILKELIKKNNITLYNAGSYRAHKKESGDYDLIVSFKKDTLENVNNYFYNLLINNNIIREVLSMGLSKSIFIIKIDNYKYYRKMDVAFIEEKYLAFYLLYFGSGREFSKRIRGIASKQGYKLNEKGLFYKNGKRVDFNPKEEREIFDFLKIPYVCPEKRLD